MTTTLVQFSYDDSPCPLIGRVIGHEDEDRVLVLWGDAAWSEDLDHNEARVECIDELAPARSRS